MEEYKRMTIDLEYYLCCETEQFILDFLDKIKAKVPVWVGIYPVNGMIKEFNAINEQLLYYISKNDIPKTNIEISISSIIDDIEKNMLLMMIKHIIEEEGHDGTTIILNRLADQFSKGHCTIPTDLILIGLDDIAYPNRTFLWDPFEFICKLVDCGVLKLNDKDSTITILRPDLLIDSQ